MLSFKKIKNLLGASLYRKPLTIFTKSPMCDRIFDTPLCFAFPESFIRVCCFLFCYPDDTYLFKVSMKTPEKYVNLFDSNNKIKAPERLLWRVSDVFVVDFEQISHIRLVFPLMTLSK